MKSDKFKIQANSVSKSTVVIKIFPFKTQESVSRRIRSAHHISNILAEGYGASISGPDIVRS